MLYDATDEDVPLLLQAIPRYRADTADGYEAMYRRLTGQPRLAKGELGQIRPLPTNTSEVQTPAPVACAPGSEHKGRKRIGARTGVGALAVVALIGGTTLVRHFATRPHEGTPTVPTTAHVRGTVIDAAQRTIKGARVSLIGRSESVVTDESGSFDLPAGVPEGTDVQIRAEHNGHRVSTLLHPAGDTPAVIVLDPDQ
jgi:hypothetical protein